MKGAAPPPPRPGPPLPPPGFPRTEKNYRDWNNVQEAVLKDLQANNTESACLLFKGVREADFTNFPVISGDVFVKLLRANRCLKKLKLGLGNNITQGVKLGNALKNHARLETVDVFGISLVMETINRNKLVEIVLSPTFGKMQTHQLVFPREVLNIVAVLLDPKTEGKDNDQCSSSRVNKLIMGKFKLADGIKKLAKIVHVCMLSTVDLQCLLTSDDVSILLEQGKNSLTHVKLNSCQLKTGNFASILKDCSVLICLDLTGNLLDSKAAKYIARGVKESKINELMLSRNPLRAKGVIKVLEASREAKFLTTLFLGYVDIKQDDEACVDPLRDNHILKRLSFEGIGKAGIIKLAQILPFCKITELIFNSNDIDAITSICLLENMRQSNVLVVTLKNWGAHGKKLEPELATNTTLLRLDVSTSFMDVAGAQFLANAIAPTQIQELVCANNKIGSEGVRLILAAGKSHLKDVNFQNCEIVNGEFASVLSEMQCLTRLDVLGNKLTAQGAMMLADALLECKSIEEVNVSRNNIGTDGATYLLEMSGKSKSMKVLKLNTCGIFDSPPNFLAALKGIFDCQPPAQLTNNTSASPASVNTYLDIGGNKPESSWTKALAESRFLHTVKLSLSDIILANLRQNSDFDQYSLINYEPNNALLCFYSLMTNKNITFLDLRRSRLESNQLIDLLKVCEESLTFLDVSGSSVSPGVFQQLSNNKKLTTFISRNHLSPSNGSFEWLNALPSLTFLDYSSSRPAVDSLAKELKSNKTLKTIIFDDVIDIHELSDNAHLDLSMKNYSDEDMPLVNVYLNKNKNLLSLNLSTNCFGNAGIKSILCNTTQRSSLTCLNLLQLQGHNAQKDCRMLEGELRTHAERFIAHTCLTRLELSVCGRWADVIISALPEMKSLSFLNISGHSVAITLCDAFAKAVLSNQVIETLCLNETAIFALSPFRAAIVQSTEQEKETTQILELDLSNKNLTNNDLMIILGLLCNKHITVDKEDSKSNNSNSNSLETDKSSISSNANNQNDLVILNLSNNKIGSRGLSSIEFNPPNLAGTSSSVPSATSSPPSSADALYLMTQLWKMSPHLNSLNLGSNRLCDEDISALCGLLQNCPSLTHLGLSKNYADNNSSNSSSSGNVRAEGSNDSAKNESSNPQTTSADQKEETMQAEKKEVEGITPHGVQLLMEKGVLLSEKLETIVLGCELRVKCLRAGKLESLDSLLVTDDCDDNEKVIDEVEETVDAESVEKKNDCDSSASNKKANFGIRDLIVVAGLLPFDLSTSSASPLVSTTKRFSTCQAIREYIKRLPCDSVSLRKLIIHQIVDLRVFNAYAPTLLRPLLESLQTEKSTDALLLRVLVERGVFELKDEQQRSFLNLVTKATLDLNNEILLFCGRFKCANVTLPEHRSATCVVFRAFDEKLKENVVLKLMKHENQYRREVDERRAMESNLSFKGNNNEYKDKPQSKNSCVLEILAKSEDFKDNRWAIDTKRVFDLDYEWGIVMYAAQRNLLIILLQERVSLLTVRKIIHAIVKCLQKMHETGRIHADLKPNNIVRMSQEEICLIDLDACVSLNSPVGAKSSTAYCPPEMCVKLANKEDYEFRLPNWSVDEKKLVVPSGKNYSLLLSDVSFDMWSLGVVLYRSIVHKPLLEADDSDNLRGKRERTALAKWSQSSLEQALNDASICLREEIGSSDECDRERLSVLDLLRWLLQPNPVLRPSSCAEVLSHAFFHLAAATHTTVTASTSVTLSDPSAAATLAVDSLSVQKGVWQLSVLQYHSLFGNTEEVLKLLSTASTNESNADSFAAKKNNDKTALHLAAEEGHWRTVELLLSFVRTHSFIQPDHRTESTGTSALQHVLMLLDSELEDDEIANNRLLCVKILCSYSNLELLTSSSGSNLVVSTLDLGRRSRNEKVRHLFENDMVLQLLLSSLKNPSNRKPNSNEFAFSVSDFNQIWASNNEEAKSRLKESVFLMLQTWGLEPSAKDKTLQERAKESEQKHAFVRRCIFPLHLWQTDVKNWENLLDLAKAKQVNVLAELCRVRDEMLKENSIDAAIMLNVKQSAQKHPRTPMRNVAQLILETKMVENTEEKRQQLDKRVLVPLARAIARSNESSFLRILLSCLQNPPTNKDELPHDWSIWLSVAPVKGEIRMQAKIDEYHDDIAVEDRESEWPFIDCVRDTLRAMVVCRNISAMRFVWEALNNTLHITTSGRIKNNLNANNKPQDILLNAVLNESQVVEIQIHHHEILAIKDNDLHLLYEIIRARQASDFIGKLN